MIEYKAELSNEPSMVDATRVHVVKIITNPSGSRLRGSDLLFHYDFMDFLGDWILDHVHRQLFIGRKSINGFQTSFRFTSCQIAKDFEASFNNNLLLFKLAYTKNE